MRITPPLALAVLCVPAGAAAQQVVEIPQSEAKVSRPDDLFRLPPDQWHFGRHLWDNPTVCASSECEAGYTSGDLAVSVEHANKFVLIIAGFRGCEAVGQSELEVGDKPGKSTFKRVSKQVERVVNGVAKVCKLTPPKIASLDAIRMFPRGP